MLNTREKSFQSIPLSVGSSWYLAGSFLDHDNVAQSSQSQDLRDQLVMARLTALCLCVKVC